MGCILCMWCCHWAHRQILEIAECLQLVLIVEVANANFLALLFKSGCLLLMRSKHCDYSLVTMGI